MTLCMAWKSDDTVHFASDSRLTIAKDSYADVGIKVLTLPLTILNPAQQDSNAPRTIALQTDLGMCFAGSAVNSLMIKESIVEVLKGLQHAPGYTDTSMEGIANFVFTAYKIISKEICQTSIGKNGIADILIAGQCTQAKSLRVFQLSTDRLNKHTITEILTDRAHVFLGTGAVVAEENLPQSPNDRDYFNVLKLVIEDNTVPTVGGHIQYGCFKGHKFVVYGLVELASPDVHYWRGALDLNSKEFMAGHSSFVPSFPYIDPFSTIGGI